MAESMEEIPTLVHTALQLSTLWQSSLHFDSVWQKAMVSADMSHFICTTDDVVLQDA